MPHKHVYFKVPAYQYIDFFEVAIRQTGYAKKHVQLPTGLQTGSPCPPRAPPGGGRGLLAICYRPIVKTLRHNYFPASELTGV